MLHASSLKIVNDWKFRLNTHEPIIDERLIEEAELYGKTLHSFTKGAWHIVEGGREFVDGWHIGAICEHLEAVKNGQIKTLLINEPPRCMKSTTVSVMFPSWCWIADPHLQFLFLSYAEKLSMKDSVKCRRIIASKWYQERWGNRYKICGDVNTKLRFDNDKTGYRISSSIGGTATGEGGDIIVLDDPNNAGDTESETIRESTNDWCDSTLSSRLNNLKTGSVIIVQQRLHAQDYSGHILSQEIPDLVHLCLPMEFETNRRCVTIPLPSTQGKPWADPRKNEGDLLWPARIGPDELSKLKIKMRTDYIRAGQLQQRPAPAEGGIIKKSWFQIWKMPTPPRCEYILQSWDTAYSKGITAACSACTTWGIFKDQHDVAQIMLLSMWHGRLENPDVRRMMIRLAKNYYDIQIDNPVPEDYILRPDMILVENKANGGPLIQDLNRAGIILTRFDPLHQGGGDKVARLRKISHIIESGKVWLPARPPSYTTLRPFADSFLEACAVFPNDENSKDIVDSMSQALIKLRLSAWIDHPDDNYIMDNYSNPNKETFY